MMIKKKLFKKSDKNKDKKEKIADVIIIIFGIIGLWGSLFLIILEYNPYDFIHAYLKDFFSMDLWLISFLAVFDIWIFIFWNLIMLLLFLKNFFLSKSFMDGEPIFEIVKGYFGFIYIILYSNGFILGAYIAIHLLIAFLSGFFSGGSEFNLGL